MTGEYARAGAGFALPGGLDFICGRGRPMGRGACGMTQPGVRTSSPPSKRWAIAGSVLWWVPWVANYFMCMVRWVTTDHTSFWRGFKELGWALVPYLNITYVWDWWMDLFTALAAAISLIAM